MQFKTTDKDREILVMRNECSKLRDQYDDSLTEIKKLQIKLDRQNYDHDKQIKSLNIII